MKKHLIITCFGYLFFGIGMTVQQLGIKAGLGYWPTIIIFTVGLIAWFVSVVTSMDKLKKFIKDHDKSKTL